MNLTYIYIMKKTLKYIIAFVILFAAPLGFSITSFAQDEDSQVFFNKTVSGPNADSVYTLTIDAYVTGNITVTKSPVPADIILVLDRSGSMADDVYGNEGTWWNPIPAAEQKINILKKSIADFVAKIKTSNGQIRPEDKDNLGSGGHRVAIVWFGDRVVTNITGLNQFIPVEQLTPVSANTNARVNYNGSNLLGVNPDGGTQTDDAMQRAESILDGVTYPASSKRTRVVVFFTDGQPGSGWYGDNWPNHSDDLGVANDCIEAANNIKTSTKYPAKVYSVGMFNKTLTTIDATTTYLRYTSSDITGKTAMPSSSGYLPVSNDYSIVVSSASQLDKVFDAISSSAGGDYSASQQSSVVLDVVSTSFLIPPQTPTTDVKVYKDTCTNTSKTQLVPTFAAEEAAGWVDITSQVTLVTNRATGEVQVKGFDYGANWVGWDDTANSGNGGPHGNRLVLKIPIKVKPDAVGGPAVETNAPGSGLTLIKENGDTISTHKFPIPVLPIPVQIWIQKQGLQGDDSAVFTLRRTPYVGTYETDDEGNYILDDDGKPKRIDYGAIPKQNWDTFTKIVVNKKNMDENGMVKITGLDPHYVYKMEEDAWGYGYTYQDGGVQYTIGDNVKNPFVFVNVPNDVKKAEAVVRNVFETRTTTIGSE